MKSLTNKKLEQGFSVIEIILAAAIFLIFSGGTIFIMLQGYTSNQLGEEETIANQYASEGLEAVRSIKNQSFSNLTNTTGAGLSRTGNVWTFNGVSNNLGKYTRTISVSAVQRDGSGNIVANGGSTDTDTKKVASTVSWNASPTRNNSIVLTTYLTNWEAVIAASNNGDGVMMYGESTNVARPFYRIYTNSTNSFSAQTTTTTSFTDTVVGKNFKIKTSPTKQEAIAGYVNGNGELRIMCFDGTTWSSEWTATVGSDGTNDQRFGIGYEKTTGDVLLVYSTDTATTNEMAYRTKSGATGCGAANWSGATNLDAVRTSGIVQWIRMEPSSVAGSNTIAIAWADKTFALSAREWTGSSFAVAEPTAALETNLERVGASVQDVPSFDIAMESTSGNLMVVWGLSQATTCTAGTAIATTNCIRYARYTTSWSAVAAIPTVADPATTIDMSANPNTNELVVASFDNSQLDLSAAYWSGSAWTGRADLDTTTSSVVAGTKLISTGWLVSGATTRSVIVYHDSGTTGVNWAFGSGGTFTVQTDFTPTPVFVNPQRWYDIQMDPKNTNQLMFTVADDNTQLFAKRLVMTSTPAFTWTNSDGGAALEATLGQARSSPYSFVYWRNP